MSLGLSDWDRHTWFQWASNPADATVAPTTTPISKAGMEIGGGGSMKLISRRSNRRPLEFYLCTRCRSDNYEDAGYAWVAFGGLELVKVVKRIEDLTDPVLQFRGLRSIVRHLSEGGEAVVHTSSKWASKNFYGRHRFHDPEHRELLNEIRQLVEERALKIEVRWVSHRENMAGSMLRLPEGEEKTSRRE